MVHAHAHQLRTTLHTIREYKTICSFIRINLYTISFSWAKNSFALVENGRTTTKKLEYFEAVRRFHEPHNIE